MDFERMLLQREMAKRAKAAMGRNEAARLAEYRKRFPGRGMAKEG